MLSEQTDKVTNTCFSLCQRTAPCFLNWQCATLICMVLNEWFICQQNNH